MTLKDIFAELVQHVLGNSVILMILVLGAIAIFSMYKCEDAGAMKEIVGNVVSAIAGAAGGAGLALAAVNRAKNGASGGGG